MISKQLWIEYSYINCLMERSSELSEESKLMLYKAIIMSLRTHGITLRGTSSISILNWIFQKLHAGIKNILLLKIPYLSRNCLKLFQFCLWPHILLFSMKVFYSIQWITKKKNNVTHEILNNFSILPSFIYYILKKYCLLFKFQSPIILSSVLFL